MRPFSRVMKKRKIPADFKNPQKADQEGEDINSAQSANLHKMSSTNTATVVEEHSQTHSDDSYERQEYNENTSQNAQFDEIKRRNSQLELIITISRQFSATLDFKSLMDTIFKRVLEVMEAEAGSFWIPDNDTNENICTIAEGPAKNQVEGLHLKQGEGIVGWVIENRLNTSIFDASKDSRFDSNIDEKTKFVTKSMLCVPMIVAKECVGAIQVINKKTVNGQFNENDLDMLENLANSAAIAIKNARLFESEQKINELNALLKISEELTSTLDLDRVLLSIVNLGSQAVQYERAVIALLDKDDQVYIAAESEEVKPDLKSQENITLKKIMDYVIHSGSSLHINNHQKNVPGKDIPDFVNEYLDEYDLQSMSVIVLSDSEGKLGLLSMEGAQPILIPPRSESVINTLANQSSIAIRNAQLYQNITSSGIADRFKSGFKISSKAKRKILITSAILGVLLFIALFIPLPSNVHSNVEITPEHKTQITSFTNGVVKSVLFKEGDFVKKGQILIKLDTSLLFLEKNKLENDLLIIQSKLQQLEREGSPSEIFQTRLEKQKLQNKIETANYNIKFASIKANRSGVVLTQKPEELKDKQVTQGETVAEIAAGDKKSASVFIKEIDILNVKKGNKISLALQSIPGSIIRGTLFDISQTKIEDEENELKNNCYIGYFGSDQLNKIKSVRYGMTGGAKIHTGYNTLFQSTFKKIFARFITKGKLLLTH